MLHLKAISKKNYASEIKKDINKHFIFILLHFHNFDNLIKEQQFDPYCWVVTLKTIKQPG